ncbi:MAG: enoyl-CoA hydratase/isomerase family protein [Bradyrhizobium sp.]|uniref:enoyl-CoA hydratase/isomerase family protein n=1 Tax=Bradyrhizobium sp. TaxID=376 RepID=UPI0025BC7298|nr:enoyl-CoA hydratase-related protein [Bradyrhizobium sp.]MBI5263029.1 enoyl-CoA hydratase/isomerase family protein [Bradyrhizobium sp.]
MPALIAERVGAVMRLELNEPDTLNALSSQLTKELSRAVAAAVEDAAVRCILLTGTGRAFCAGGDVRAMDDRRPGAVRALVETHHGWMRQLLNGGKPVVTAVNGLAVGAGLAIALLGDIVIASDAAVFRSAFLGLGAVPDLGLAFTLPRAVGFQRASDIILTNRVVKAEEAERIGLVARIVPADELQPEAMRAAEALASGPTAAMGLARELLRRAHDTPLEQFLQTEALAQAAAFGTDDFAEGVAALREKRPARFSGR